MHAFAYLAFEIANERSREAARTRLAHLATEGRPRLWRRVAAPVVRVVRPIAAAAGRRFEAVAEDLNRPFASQE